MHCPLCGGPVEATDPDAFACAVGHVVASEALERHAELRLAEAMWMAIEALESEAEVLEATGTGGAGTGFAADARGQASGARRRLLTQPFGAISRGAAPFV